MAIRLFDYILETLSLQGENHRPLVSMILNKDFKQLAEYFRMDSSGLVEYLKDQYGLPVKEEIPLKIFRKQQRLANLDTLYPYLKFVQRELDNAPDDEDTRNAILGSVLDEMEKVETSARLPATVSVVDEVFRRHVT